VTPYHADLVWHADRARTARVRTQQAARGGGAAPALRLRARGETARALVGRDVVTAGGWDAVVEDVELDDLLAPQRATMDGWLGPPWIRAGWFHAYLLQRGTLGDAAAGRQADALRDRLAAGQVADTTERVRSERELVGLLGRGCERVVLGYTTRREVYSADFSVGIENVASDSQEGLATPVFVRTAKLKDFPWNGWLDLATPTRPRSAWNPIGGFTDPGSRLLWAAIGDPALFPTPAGADWIGNRASVEGAAPSKAAADIGKPVAIPEDALLPEAGSGSLRPVGPGRTADVRLRYRVLGSAFHDGTRSTMADLLYPFVVAYRWGQAGAPGQVAGDAGVATATAVLRQHLAGLRPAGTETRIRAYDDVRFVDTIHSVDVYLRGVGPEAPGLGAVAPPWGPVPWHVLALVEEAARRGQGAFSRAEAERRRGRWLDVVRDPRTRAMLRETLAAWQRAATVPPALAGLVTAAEARARWSALGAFARERGHVLATGGPYRLDRVTPDGAVLGVFRDLTYPLGVGTYDRLAAPRRAYVRSVDTRGDRLIVAADIEMIERVMRDTRVVREPLEERITGISPEDVPRCRYLVVGADGDVARAGLAPFAADARFAVDLAGLAAGDYTVVLALTLEDAELDPEVRLIQYRAGS
jgi:hypothetical protein